ncbi:hypothetical protein HNP38_001382 [Chryseobacterium defluvii]|uniref:Ankyrin repeat protein n=1 Tax=Chryseobacterium defluvii TaxID=160396 RepID=A0A840KF09_9FLAO|nr:ankyrin repeat domain-containing protein [Chryseobacterium defluvii]MBB4806110.1 hypothetical protein [Chryseobacterium defluvii]
MDYFQKIIYDIEVLSPEGIKECFENGVDPNGTFRDKPLINELITGYLRSERFKECIRVFTEYGLDFNDQLLLAVLTDDASSLEEILTRNPSDIHRKYSFNCAFTPLHEASLLHICAEYNHLSCAKVLIAHGFDVNTKAGIDENGFGGHTAIFHTVNQNSGDFLEFTKHLISESSDLTYTVKGLIWGENYEWETFIPSVNPMSYAMMGLLPQFQRTERQIYDTVSVLLKGAYGIDYIPVNVPNTYLGK